MRSAHLSVLSLLGLAIVVTAAGCGGGSSAVTGPEAVPIVVGNGVIQGTVRGPGFLSAPSAEVSASSADSTMTVRVEGTPLATGVDEEGGFILAGVPAGDVTLLFEGAGTSARLGVSGVLDGQVMTLEVQVSGANVHVTTPPQCAPTSSTKITGVLQAMSGTHLDVGGHVVDASQVHKVWRGDRRIELSQLQVGEKLKVWGTLRGDGVLVAEEIKALTSGESKWVTFKGRITKVVSSSSDVHANPYSGSCLTLHVAGRVVLTDESTRFKKKGGGTLDPGTIKVGQRAYVEGWRKPNGRVRAEKVVIG